VPGYRRQPSLWLWMIPVFVLGLPLAVIYVCVALYKLGDLLAYVLGV
jgi:hypothetical protein